MSAKSHPLQHSTFSEPFPYDVYLPREGKDRPVIFQTPILGRLSFFEDLFWEHRWARFFAEQGFVSVLIHRPIFAFDSAHGLEQIQDYLMNSLKKNQAVLEAVFAQGYGDPARAGSYGISFGSIVNCLWASQEPRLSTNVFALTGGNLPDIFMASRDPLMAGYRRGALSHCGGDAEKLRSSLKTLFSQDPLTCGKAAPDKTLMILARFDQVVPFRYGMALREKLGNPKTIYLPLDHYLSMFISPGLKWKIVNFFKEKLGN